MADLCLRGRSSPRRSRRGRCRHVAPFRGWPALPYAAWKDTCQTLHLWTQIVGKIRLARTPWLNHSWHVALYVTARGLTTSPIPARRAQLRDRVRFHRSCAVAAHQRRPRPAARAQADDGGGVLWRRAACARRARHRRAHQRDAERDRRRDPVQRRSRACRRTTAMHANRFWRVLLLSHDVFAQFRTGFLGKASPVHFFWGSFDLAVTRFSGRTRAAPSRRRAEPARQRGAGGLFARGLERGLLAGRRRDRLSRLLFLCLSGAGGFCGGARAARAGVLLQGAGRIHPAL